jgi:hypothetical protein
MARRALPKRLKNVVTTLRAEEKRTLRDSMGIDVNEWRLIEPSFSNFQGLRRKYVREVAAMTNAGAPRVKSPDDRKKCSGCGRLCGRVEYYLKLLRGTVICNRCLDHLQVYARADT